MINLLALTYFLTILFEIQLNYFTQSSSPKIILLDHIQSSWLLTILFNSSLKPLIFILLLIILLKIIHNHRSFIIYIIILKFFELIPILIDLINLLFIYQYKINQQNSFIQLNLSLIFVLIRLIINLNVIRQWKGQILIIFDFLLFIFINVSLIRYSGFNLIRIGRKIILGLLIFKLKRNNHLQYHQNSLSIIQRILFIRWILSLFIFSLFIFYIIQWTNIDENSFSLKNVFNLLKSYSFLLIICLTILFVIRRDTLHNRYTLEKKFEFNLKLPDKKKECLVCCDEKSLNEFDPLVTTGCHHSQRSVCNSCLFQHVQKTFQITFTDDIYCPELECGVKLNYETVRILLFLNGDNKIVERYDQYVFHRGLEQMDEFIWCSNPSCQVGQLNEGGKLNNIVTCYYCHTKTCFTHKVKWHEGLSCEEYELGIDPVYESSRRWIVENSKKCPQCPYQIEKNDGCDHMTCLKCKHEFCWSCLADFKPIRDDGNHRHKSTCKHYASFDGEQNLF